MTLRRRRKEARPAEILAAALEEFAAKGFAATRLDAVAARAGVSKGTLYLYFSTKEELFKAMVRQMVVPTFASLDDLIASAAEDTPTLLRRLLRHLACQLAGSPAGRLPKIIIAESGTFPDLAAFWVEEVIGRGRGVMQHLLDRGMARGEFAAPLPDPMQIFAPILLLTLWNTALAPAVGRSFAPDAFADQAATLLLNGLRTRPEGTP